MPKYIVTIGLEVHAQLTTRSKMFCACPVEYGAEPNTHTCPTCLGLPGALPVLNEAAIEKTILTGMMLGCTTPPVVNWDRKNYFYPDMPKNYQITQMPFPLCLGGGVPLGEFDYPKDAQKSIANPGKVVKLTRIHLEEDVGKSTHYDKFSALDFNRAGTPLMEIVSEPDIDSAEEAFAYITSLRQILISCDASDADMEKGNLRCDVNISVRPEGQKELGVKIELKNINSMSAVRRAIKAETERQIDILEGRNPEPLIQSTRRWDDDRGETTLMRTKEDAHDYRYFPDPDLLPVHTDAIKKRILSAGPLPETPKAKAEKYVSMGLSTYTASVLSATPNLSGFFEDVTMAWPQVQPIKIANWVNNEFLAKFDPADFTVKELKFTPAHFGELVHMVETNSLSAAQGKEVFNIMVEHGGTGPAIAKDKDFKQVSDTGALEAIVEKILADNPDKVAEVKGGNEKAMNWFTGQAMKASQGKANPKMVTEIVRKRVLG